MKSIINYRFAFFLFLFSVFSCEVERLPETSISDQTFWKSETDLIAALNRYLSHPEYDAAAREKLIEIEVCKPIAGISKRITDELLQWM